MADKSSEIAYLETVVKGRLKEYHRPNWLAVTADVEDKLITLKVYIDGEVSDNDVEVFSYLGGYILGDYPPEYKLNDSCVSIEKHSPQNYRFLDFQKGVFIPIHELH